MRLQVLHDQAIAFQDGTHHHYHLGAPDPLAAVEASIQATHAGNVLGAVIDQWGPGRAGGLGVNASITVHDEISLTPYITRPHDHELRDKLQTLTNPAASSRLVLVVGASCAGKTRTLYEAVLAVLPDWQLVAPRTDTDLARLLTGGIPARTVIWLDELQNKLTKLSDGVTAAKAVDALLKAREVGPLLFAGTIWPHELQALQQRPTPEQAAVGAAAIRDLLALAHTILVPDTFTDIDLIDAPADPRLRIAITTASGTSLPNQGIKLTQVLAGGTQLVHRLRCELGAPGAFSPAARAVVRAAGDLRRVGMPNPLPRWALEGSSIGYLDGQVQPPDSTWFQKGLSDLTAAAALEDSLTGPPTLDIHVDGVPALTPAWAAQPDGALTEGYDMHDYLFEDHLLQNGSAPTAAHLWEVLIYDSALIPEHAAPNVARDAEDRGLYLAAAALLEASAGNGYIRNAPRRAYAMIKKIDAVNRFGSPTLPTPRPSSGRREDLARRIAALGQEGGSDELEELRKLAASGSRRARRTVVQVLARMRLDPAADDELIRMSQKGVRAARGLRVADQKISKLRSRLLHGRSRAGPVLFEALARRDARGDCEELEMHVHAARPSAAAALMMLHHARNPTTRLVGLDVNAAPVVASARPTAADELDTN